MNSSPSPSSDISFQYSALWIMGDFPTMHWELGYDQNVTQRSHDGVQRLVQSTAMGPKQGRVSSWIDEGMKDDDVWSISE